MNVNETFISFYLRANRVHVYVDALYALGCPNYVRFLISEDGHSLALVPYHKKDFSSHRVHPGIYNGQKCMELSSIRLCKVLSKMHSWDNEYSYRVPGTIVFKQKVVIFWLCEAEKIEHDF